MKKTAVAVLCALAASPLVCAETVEADLVVVGGGPAGLAAALQATEQGAKVVLVEAGSVIQEGVQTASGALPSGTVLLKGDRHESWLSRFAAIEHISPEIQKNRGNPLAPGATIEWLEKRGITFTSHVFTDHDHIRWKKVVKCGDLEGGEALLGCVADAASKLGADIRSFTKTEEILIEDGRVAGVRATTVSGEELVVKAPVAIVAGVDFTSLRNGPTGTFSPVVPSYGILAARKAGAERVVPVFLRAAPSRTLCMHLQEAIVDMARQPYNIWIGAKGSRIVNEAQVYRDAGITGVFPKPSDGSAVWAVWDDATVDQILLKSAASRVAGAPMETPQVKQLRSELQEAAAAGSRRFVTAGYLSELAMKIGVSGDELKRTILAYNKAATKGLDDQFGKPAHWMRPVKGPHYYAFKLEAEHYAAASGVAVDQSLHVLDKHDRPIAGLYAAGVGIGSIGGVADGTFTIWTDANALGWSVYSGRKAALEALTAAKDAKPAATDKAVREE